MNELADRLEARWTDTNSSEEDAAIIKALRFAANMERLRRDGLTVTVYPQSNGSVILNYNGCDYAGPDIYTAARKAVEELEKGEGK